MRLRCMVGDLFGGTDQLLAKGDQSYEILGDCFIARWPRGYELSPDLGDQVSLMHCRVDPAVPSTSPQGHRYH